MKKKFTALFLAMTLTLTLGLALTLPVAANSIGLAGLWHFDEANTDLTTSVMTTPDSSGLSNTGTLMPFGSEPTQVPGRFGTALNFDGVDDYVEVADDATIESSNITVEAWVKNSSSPGTYRYIVSKYYEDKSGSWSSYALYTGGTGGLFFYVGSTTTAKLSPDAGTGIWDGEWHHIVGTYDGSMVRLYVDGAEVGTGTSATLSIAYDEGDLFIGTYVANQTRWCFPGVIDEVRVWNGVLTADQIVASYALGTNDTGVTVLSHQNLLDGGVAIFTSAFYVGRDLDPLPTVNARAMIVGSDATMSEVLAFRKVTPKGEADYDSSSVTNGFDITVNSITGKVHSLHLSMILNTGEGLGVNLQFLPYDW